jgi:hypothetical protein
MKIHSSVLELLHRGRIDMTKITGIFLVLFIASTPKKKKEKAVIFF